jgi:hypothetical protein
LQSADSCLQKVRYRSSSLTSCITCQQKRSASLTNCITCLQKRSNVPSPQYYFLSASIFQITMASSGSALTQQQGQKPSY